MLAELVPGGMVSHTFNLFP